MLPKEFESGDPFVFTVANYDRVTLVVQILYGF